MRSARPGIAVVAAVAAVTVLGCVAARSAGSPEAASPSLRSLTIAVIGDVPYGEEQEESVGSLVDAINDDPRVSLAVHLGDLKNGSTPCSDERLAAALAMFASFDDPVVYTPGDNEWTDCHRPSSGRYDPLERLGQLRATFFAEPGSSLGRHPRTVEHEDTVVENVRLTDSGVALATLHVVGSDNGLEPWSGLGHTAPTPEQAAEVSARVSAAVTWVDETFDAAQDAGLRGVVLAMQADTWAPLPTLGQQPVVDRIMTRSATFDGEVLLLQGDSHHFLVDDPLGLDGFTRIVVHGETLPFEYLRLTIDPAGSELFTWERVPVTD
jgi:hypothetical protein